MNEKSNSLHVISCNDTQNSSLLSWEEAFHQYKNLVYSICLKYLHNADLAEDAMQETFLKAYANRHQFDGAKQKSWLTTIAANVCKDILRSAWHRRVACSEEIDCLAQQHMEYGFDPDILHAVKNLKPHYRDVIILFYYYDMKITDIAKSVQAPQSTVSVRLKRARDILKKQLDAS